MIIFVNGPPGSGKTTAIHHLTTTRPNCASYRMARPIDRAVPELLQIDYRAWDTLEKGYKDDPVVFDKSPRELKILLANFLKSVFGPAIFGEIAMIAMRGLIFEDIAIDIGHTAEAEVIVKKMKDIRQTRCVCIQLERDGCSFTNDSREYIDCDKLGIPVRKICNRHELDMFLEQVNVAVLALEPPQ